MDDTARGWGKTFGGVIGASFGPEGALVGMAIGGLLEAVLPGPKAILGNILGDLGVDGVKQSWRRVVARLSPDAVP